MYTRILEGAIKERFFKGKALVLLGPRQVGKTTLIRKILQDQDFVFLNGDDPDDRRLLESAGVSRLRLLAGQKNILFIDEAQRIPDIGLIAKIVTDQLPTVQLILSGSSALEINNATQEPLTGRKFEYPLYPICWEELEVTEGFVSAYQQLEERLVFGMYPDVLNNRSDATEILKQLGSSYLYKDVLAVSGLKKPELLEKLVKALALQLGSEVSYNELANLLEVDKATVSRYIDLLEKAFIVFRLSSFSRNQRNEIRNNRKIYFYDNGIRNMVINNLNPIDLRTDKGALWENFLISERMKMQAYHQQYTSRYFWRTVQKQEIDLIEERGGKIFAFEFKWKNAGRKKIPASFLENYQATGQIIDRENFREFLMPEAT
jgi:hypothetical protein